MRILENKEKNKIYGLMGNINISTNNNNYRIVSFYKFNDTVKNYLNSPKASSALKMVMLNDEYLDKTISNLSTAEIKKVILAHALIENKETLILDYFEKELTNAEKEYFKRLFKRLVTDYHKTIIIFTNDLSYIWEISESIIYVDNQEVINTFSKNDMEILNCVAAPPISEFIALLKNKSIPLNDYKNTSDLLKAIYRLKEN